MARPALKKFRRIVVKVGSSLLISGATGAGVKDALRALAEVIGEAPVSQKAKGAAQAEPWAPTTP